jgi:hypothetical protein
MMETMLAPMAKWMSRPKTRVRTGTTRIPPPKPMSEPSKPAKKETKKRINAKSSIPAIVSSDHRTEVRCPSSPASVVLDLAVRPVQLAQSRPRTMAG